MVWIDIDLLFIWIVIALLYRDQCQSRRYSEEFMKAQLEAVKGISARFAETEQLIFMNDRKTQQKLKQLEDK